MKNLKNSITLVLIVMIILLFVFTFYSFAPKFIGKVTQNTELEDSNGLVEEIITLFFSFVIVAAVLALVIKDII